MLLATTALSIVQAIAQPSWFLCGLYITGFVYSSCMAAFNFFSQKTIIVLSAQKLLVINGQ